MSYVHRISIDEDSASLVTTRQIRVQTSVIDLNCRLKSIIDRLHLGNRDFEQLCVVQLSNTQLLEPEPHLQQQPRVRLQETRTTATTWVAVAPTAPTYRTTSHTSHYLSWSFTHLLDFVQLPLLLLELFLAHLTLKPSENENTWQSVLFIADWLMLRCTAKTYKKYDQIICKIISRYNNVQNN